MVDTPEATRRLTVEKRVMLLLATLLVANPFMLFLLSKRALVSVLVSSACVGLVQLVFTRRSHNLLAAYVFNALVLVFAFVHAEVILLSAFPERVVENLYTVQRGYYFNPYRGFESVRDRIQGTKSGRLIGSC